MRPRTTAARSLGGLTDDELIERSRAGDTAAFSTLADRHWEHLVRLCRHHLDGDAHQAQDVAQECLVKLHATIDRDHRPLQPRAWLSVVARHACIDVHRRRRLDLVDQLPERRVDDEDPFDVDPVLGEAWEALSERHRTVLHHRELMGLSYDEIATAMGISCSAVETLLFRARTALRRGYVRAGGRLLGCGLFGVSLSRLVDGHESPELASHVASCGPCISAVDRLGVTTGLLRSGPPVPPAALSLLDRARDWVAATLAGPAATLTAPALSAGPAVGAAITAAVLAVAPLAVPGQRSEPSHALVEAVVDAASPAAGTPAGTGSVVTPVDRAAPSATSEPTVTPPPPNPLAFASLPLSPGGAWGDPEPWPSSQDRPPPSKEQWNDPQWTTDDTKPSGEPPKRWPGEPECTESYCSR